MTFLLIAEFLNEISEMNVMHKSRCLQLKDDLIQLSANIQHSSQDEIHIKFLMSQKDTRGRTAFDIASDNSYYSVLQIEEVGSIIGKKWNGNISYNGKF